MPLPPSARRVSLHTAATINRTIRRQMAADIHYFALHPDEIPARLEELDREWDVERTLEANASTLALTGTLLAATVSKKFLVVPGVVMAFLLQHALQGWCPPLPVFRRLGFRTRAEIDEERYALKALRGDFGAAKSADESLQAVGTQA